MICTYCRRVLDDDSSDTYHAIVGWGTIDGTTHLQWIPRDVFACCPCVEEHFVDSCAPTRGVGDRLAELLRGDDEAV
jgi:hypothetical protein